MRSGAVLVLSGLVGAFVPSSEAQEAKPVLEGPLTPGSLALLIGHQEQPGVLERWASALKDPSAAVRAAGARVIYVSGAAVLVAALEAALEVETDPEAAVEEARALGALGTSRDDARLVAAGKRLAVSEPMAQILARNRGPEALPYRELLGETPSDASLDTFVTLATRGESAGLNRVAADALDRDDEDTWRTALLVSRRSKAELLPEVLVRGLAATSDDVRGLACFFVALAMAENEPLAPAVREAAESTLARDRPATLEGSFACDLLGRVVGRASGRDPRWLAGLKARPFPTYLNLIRQEPALLERLTAEEARTFRRAMPSDYPDPRKIRKERAKILRHGSIGLPYPNVRTPTGFPRGFVASVLEATGCHMRDARGFELAWIHYGVDGRPRDVVFREPEDGEPPSGPAGCQAAARTLLVSALVPTAHLPRLDARETILVMLKPECLKCLTEEVGLVRGPGETVNVDEPRPVTTVPPDHPMAVRSARLEGTVILEAVITETGCVQSLEVELGVPALDWGAIRAVSQWRYKPARLRGVPVPVRMRVMVGFPYFSR